MEKKLAIAAAFVVGAAILTAIEYALGLTACMSVLPWWAKIGYATYWFTWSGVVTWTMFRK